MGAAYFIALDNPNPGFDSFVNGKAVARDAKQLSRIASRLGLKKPDDYVSMRADQAVAMAEEFGVGDDMEVPAEQWFEADEGIAWVAKLRAHLQSNPKAVKDVEAVIADLSEYERVLIQAKAVGAKWHLSADF